MAQRFAAHQEHPTGAAHLDELAGGGEAVDETAARRVAVMAARFTLAYSARLDSSRRTMSPAMLVEGGFASSHWPTFLSDCRAQFFPQVSMELVGK